MKRFNWILLFLFTSLSIMAKDDITIYIGSANRYASVNLPDYRRRICKRYKIRPYYLEDCFRKCGHDWGNVGMVLEIAHVTGKHVREVCDIYSKHYQHGWRYVLHKLGIRQGTHAYDVFYHDLCNYGKSWDDCCESHLKYHKSHRICHKRDKWYDDDDDDDDEEEDDLL